MNKAMQTWKRLGTNTPRYFQWLRMWALIIGTMAGAAITANATLDVPLDGRIFHWCKYVIVICASIAATASVTTTDRPLSQK